MTYVPHLRGLKLFLLVAAALAALLLAPASAPAQNSAAPSPKDPKALAILERAAKAHAALASYEVGTKIIIKMKIGDTNLDSTLNYQLRVERPNRFTMTGDGEGVMAMAMQTDYYCDGKTLSTYMRGVQAYVVEPAPERFEELNSGAGGLGGINPASMLANLLGSGDSGQRFDAVASARWIGVEPVEGAPCDHIRIVTEDAGISAASDLWIAQGDAPLPRRIVPDLSNLDEVAGKVGDKVGDALGEAASGVDVKSLVKGLKSHIQIDFIDWKPGAAFPADAFSFVPPAGARKVDSLINAMMQGAGSMLGGAEAGADAPPEDGGRPEDLEGKPAPALSLPLRGGGTFELASLKTKQRAVLCFFSPTSAPSAKALAALEGLLANMTGVAFVPVAMLRAEGDLEAFAAANKLKAPIAIDRDGATGKAYRAESLPQTVIVGADGKIEHVRIGYSSKLADHVKEMLEAKP